MKKNSLLFVHIPTHFKEMIRVARALKNSENYKPIIYFYALYKDVGKDIEQCRLEGIDYLGTSTTDLNKGLSTDTGQPDKPGRNLLKSILARGLRLASRLVASVVKCFENYFLSLLRKIIPNRFKKHLISFLERETTAKLCVSFYKGCFNLFPNKLPPISRAAYSSMIKVESVINTHHIELMVFPEHNLFYFTQLSAYLGRQKKIPSIIVPFTIANTIEWAETFYNESSRTMEKSYNRIFSFIFPQWTHTYKNRQLILPVELILFYEMLELTPKNPWLLNSGDIDFLAVESEAMKDYYITAGIDAKHLKSTGALYNDELFQQMQCADENRSELYNLLKFNNNKPMILCALPPNQIEGREKQVDFKTYEEIIRYLVEEMVKYTDSFNLVINLHPRIIKESVSFLEKYPVNVSSLNLTQLIPISSIYIASCSATIRMANSCGIPVINYDLYKYNYDDYVESEGVLTMESQKEFSDTLHALVTNTEYYEEIKNNQKKQNSRWGELNGQAGKNLLAEIDRLFVPIQVHQLN